jgi:hypothetical protein
VSVRRLVVSGGAVLAGLIPVAAAHAAVPDRVAQDDSIVVCNWHNRARALAQMRDGGFTHVRINVVHTPGAPGNQLLACALPATLADYDRAVDAVLAAGLVPQLTLFWYRQTDPAAIAAWMRGMAAHFAPKVHRFSVLNEPDLSLPASDACDPRTVSRLVSDGALNVSIRTQKVKRYLRHRVRVRRHGRTVRVWRPVYRYRHVRRHHRHRRVRYRVYRWHTTHARVVRAPRSSVQQSTTVANGCLRIQRGRAYHRIFTAAAPAIRAAAPGAQVLAGETSPVPGVDLFIREALPLQADGWAHHCYQWDATPTVARGGFGVGDTARVQALVGMPLYYTECAYAQPDSAWTQRRWPGVFTHDNLPGAYTQMWQFARDQGVREMSQFGWCEALTHKWDTSLMRQDDCGASAEYSALQRLLLSW